MTLRPGPRESMVLLIFRVALGAVFAFAAYQKLKNPAALLEFRQSIEAFKLLGDQHEHLIMVATYAVPWAEGLCAGLLVLGLWTRSAALLLTLALAGFIAAIVSALQRGLDFPCGCFGKISFPCSPEKLTMCGVYRNVALAIPALYLLIRGGGSLALDRFLGPRRAPPAGPGPGTKPVITSGSAGAATGAPATGLMDVPGT